MQGRKERAIDTNCGLRYLFGFGFLGRDSCWLCARRSRVQLCADPAAMCIGWDGYCIKELMNKKGCLRTKSMDFTCANDY